MFYILQNIQSLSQHCERLMVNPQDYMPTCCPYCNHHKLWRHGGYPRKPDRNNKSCPSLNPILIPRFRCAACRRTCSVLPECIAPRRWYLWKIQQAVFELVLLGQSYRSIAKALIPSRRTIGRWIARFIEQFKIYGNAMRSEFPDLGRHSNPINFWQAALSQSSLSQWMAFLHQHGVLIP